MVVYFCIIRASPFLRFLKGKLSYSKPVWLCYDGWAHLAALRTWTPLNVIRTWLWAQVSLAGTQILWGRTWGSRLPQPLSQILLARGHAWDPLYKPDSADNPITSQRDSNKSEERADALLGETSRWVTNFNVNSYKVMKRHKNYII